MDYSGRGLKRDDAFHDECGVFGIFGASEAATLTHLGLHGLQHRGQESAGIVTVHEGRLRTHRGMGLVADVFTQPELEHLLGHMAIGHVRYSTAGTTSIRNCQPYAVDYARGSLAVAHNGTLTNAGKLKVELEDKGSLFHSTSDSEIFLHLLAHNREGTLAERLQRVVGQTRGAYSLVVMTRKAIAGVRDPHGFRPLVLGRRGDAWILSSETSALALIEAEYVREVAPGEIVVIDEDGLHSYRSAPEDHPVRQCVFEHVYFGRPDSIMFGRAIYNTRKEMGRRLALQAPPPDGADMVIPVPDSGNAAALGYARELGVPFEMGLVRSHYVGRTFIEPTQSIRHFGVKLKLSAITETLEGKSVVVVDDSLVRGTTSRKIIQLLRAAGAAKVHVRISCPPTIRPCYFGIDTPSQSELIAANKTIPEIAEFLNADSLAYLAPKGLHEAVGDTAAWNEPNRRFCNACFTEDYPLPPPSAEDEALARK
ncbi:MAG: amidophosphoribosyltransferase [Myxococcota bacterium]|jgi:amidophosphoribosyltransferase